MKIIILAILTCITSSAYSQNDDIKNINSYLSHPQVSKAAKDYYNKKFKASDDIRTFSIFDSLKTKNNFTRPFYMFLCSKIMEHSDGALSEFAGSAAKAFVEENPTIFIHFFKRPNNLLDTEKYFKVWANRIAGEIAIECEKSEDLCLEKTIKVMKSNSKKVDPVVNRGIERFGSFTRKYLIQMNKM